MASLLIAKQLPTFHTQQGAKRPVCIIICGLPGTGKTTVAKMLAKKMGGALLRTDVIRREIGRGGYGKEEMQEVYEEMLRRAKKLLKAGKHVILDATFNQRKNRKAAQKIAKALKTPFKIIKTVCDEKIIKEKISGRAGDESEAKFKHYLEYKKIFEPVRQPHFIIDTSGNIEKQLKKILKYVKN